MELAAFGWPAEVPPVRRPLAREDALGRLPPRQPGEDGTVLSPDPAGDGPCRAVARAVRRGSLECDETTFGGARKGKRGWGAAGKVIVFGIVKRNGLVKAQPIPAHDRASIMRVIQAESREGSLYYTDEWQAYATLRMRGDHVVIRKQKGRPLGRDHINGIEGFWSYAKNWLYPYRGVPKKFFHLHLGETCYRFNHRDEDLKPLIIKLLKTTEHHKIDRNPVQSG